MIHELQVRLPTNRALRITRIQFSLASHQSKRTDNRLTHSSMSRSLSGCAITSSCRDQLNMFRTSSKLIVNVRSSVAMTGGSDSPPSAAPMPPPSDDMSGRETRNSMHSAADDRVAMQSELSLLNVALICMKRLKNAVGTVSSAL